MYISVQLPVQASGKHYWLQSLVLVILFSDHSLAAGLLAPRCGFKFETDLIFEHEVSEDVLHLI